MKGSTDAEKSSSTLSESHAKSDPLKHTRSGRCLKFNTDYTEKCTQKRQRQNMIYQVKKALKKSTSERTKDDNDLLTNCQDLVKHVDISEKNRIIAQAHQEIVIDDSELLQEKCKELADAIIKAESCVFYTGAGISTSASIPDYRGPNGLWTLQEKGQKVQLPDFTIVKPTYSHMALQALVQSGIVTHIVSQNCDGLHLRSGLDRNKLSELHGNCFVEFCTDCSEEYLRLFDVTEKSSFRKHGTGRYCAYCNKEKISSENGYQLKDSIIHFGEKLREGSPYNWEEAIDSVKKTKLIICLGTSLKVLKHYACLWPKKKSVDIMIVSIQWTPKDKLAKLKINGYCDQVMKYLIENLQTEYKNLKVSEYSLKTDPIFKIAVDLKEHELKTTTKPIMLDYNGLMKKSKSQTVLASVKPECKDDLNKSDGDLETETAENLDSWFTKSFKPRKKALSKKKKS